MAKRQSKRPSRKPTPEELAAQREHMRSVAAKSAAWSALNDSAWQVVTSALPRVLDRLQTRPILVGERSFSDDMRYDYGIHYYVTVTYPAKLKAKLSAPVDLAAIKESLPAGARLLVTDEDVRKVIEGVAEDVSVPAGPIGKRGAPSFADRAAWDRCVEALKDLLLHHSGVIEDNIEAVDDDGEEFHGEMTDAPFYDFRFRPLSLSVKLDGDRLRIEFVVVPQVLVDWPGKHRPTESPAF